MENLNYAKNYLNESLIVKKTLLIASLILNIVKAAEIIENAYRSGKNSYSRKRWECW